MDRLVSDELQDALQAKFETDLKTMINDNAIKKRFLKGNVIIRQDQKIDALYFITKGLVRGFYLDDDGNEVTKCFSHEYQFAGAEGILGVKEASFSVDCLENVTCFAFPFSIFQKDFIKKQCHEIFEKVGKSSFVKVDKHQKEMLLFDAETRYLKFLSEYPFLENRIKQEYIASYIGIRPSSLSRIKRKFKK